MEKPKNTESAPNLVLSLYIPSLLVSTGQGIIIPILPLFAD
jgi:hypothetical protein